MCLAYGVIKKEGQLICPVDASGKFTSEVKDFAGQYVKVRLRLYKNSVEQAKHFICVSLYVLLYVGCRQEYHQAS